VVATVARGSVLTRVAYRQRSPDEEPRWLAVLMGAIAAAPGSLRPRHRRHVWHLHHRPQSRRGSTTPQCTAPVRRGLEPASRPQLSRPQRRQVGRAGSCCFPRPAPKGPDNRRPRLPLGREIPGDLGHALEAWLPDSLGAVVAPDTPRCELLGPVTTQLGHQAVGIRSCAPRAAVERSPRLRQRRRPARCVGLASWGRLLRQGSYPMQSAHS